MGRYLFVFTIIKNLHVHEAKMNVPLHHLKAGYAPDNSCYFNCLILLYVVKSVTK